MDRNFEHFLRMNDVVVTFWLVTTCAGASGVAGGSCGSIHWERKEWVGVESLLLFDAVEEVGGVTTGMMDDGIWMESER